MPFDPISIREAMIKITNKEWVLPITQRPYEWGDRANFQKGIYRLFDSLYRNYPIGAFLIWHTSEEIPYTCLQYKFCGMVLCFDLLFDPTKNEDDSYGFKFFTSNSEIEPRYLRLNLLY